LKRKVVVGHTLYNLTRNTVVAEDTRVAATFWGRLRGLIGCKQLDLGKALMIVPCRSIHTWFMRFPIDVLFLDREMRVIHRATVEPWRFGPVVKDAWRVVEMPAGLIGCSATTVGDKLGWELVQPSPRMGKDMIS